MTNTDPGPGRYRLVGMIRDAIAKLQSQFDAALDAFTTRMNDELAQVDAAITGLNTIAGEAQDAIEASAADRAELHTALDALTARVTALEAAPAGPPPSAQ